MRTLFNASGSRLKAQGSGRPKAFRAGRWRGRLNHHHSNGLEGNVAVLLRHLSVPWLRLGMAAGAPPRLSALRVGSRLTVETLRSKGHSGLHQPEGGRGRRPCRRRGEPPLARCRSHAAGPLNVSDQPRISALRVGSPTDVRDAPLQGPTPPTALRPCWPGSVGSQFFDAAITQFRERNVPVLLRQRRIRHRCSDPVTALSAWSSS